MSGEVLDGEPAINLPTCYLLPDPYLRQGVKANKPVTRETGGKGEGERVTPGEREASGEGDEKVGARKGGQKREMRASLKGAERDTSGKGQKEGLRAGGREASLKGR